MRSTDSHSRERVLRRLQSADHPAYLRVEGRIFAIGDGPQTIGRAQSADLSIRDEAISRTHAQLVPAGDGHVLVDLDSSNGITVNGRRTKQRILENGDRIQLGNTLLVYRRPLAERDRPTRHTPVEVKFRARARVARARAGVHPAKPFPLSWMAAIGALVVLAAAGVSPSLLVLGLAGALVGLVVEYVTRPT